MENVIPKVGTQSYRGYLRRKVWILFLLVFSLISVILMSLSTGSSGISLGTILRGLMGAEDIHSTIILWNIRMPRVATAIVVGAALAMAGSVMQCVLRNPLASSSTLGVSQGASFGAAFAIVVLEAGVQINSASAGAVTVTNPALVTVFAFLGGMLTTMVILGISRLSHLPSTSMVLTGVALSSLFTGGTTILQYFADDVKIASVVYWTFGDLGRANWREISIIFALAILAYLYFLGNRWNYNAMETGLQTAKSLGVHVDRLMLGSMVLCSLITAVSVAFVGVISFIGLIAPHFIRRWIGNDHRFLIPASALTGSILLVLAELVSRTIVSPSILPIGALTSFLGAPMFLFLLLKGVRTR